MQTLNYQSQIGYAIFKSESIADRRSILLDLSGLPAEGQNYRTFEVERLYKYYTDLGYTVYIVLHGSLCSWSREHLIRNGVCASAIIDSYLSDGNDHTLEAEVEYTAKLFNELGCGQLHCVCAKSYCLTKQFAYIKYGICSHMHMVQNAEFKQSNTGTTLSSVSYMQYCL